MGLRHTVLAPCATDAQEQPDKRSKPENEKKCFEQPHMHTHTQKKTSKSTIVQGNKHSTFPSYQIREPSPYLGPNQRIANRPFRQPDNTEGCTPSRPPTCTPPDPARRPSLVDPPVKLFGRRLPRVVYVSIQAQPEQKYSNRAVQRCRSTQATPPPPGPTLR